MVDFYCDSVKLAIEVDGSQHDYMSDAPRTTCIEQSGVKVLKFRDNEVLQNTEAVLETILKVAGDSALTPALPRRERGKTETHDGLD